MIKKLLRRKVAIVLFIIGAIAYINVGILLGDWFTYALYHPNSLAAKILTPIPPFKTEEPTLSPFSSLAPKIDPEFEKKYGTFENYKKEKLVGRIIFAMLWPMVLVSGFIICSVLWLAYLFWTAILFAWAVILSTFKIIWWLINGGLLEYFCLRP